MAIDLSKLAVVSSEAFDVKLNHPATGEQLFDGDKAVAITILSKTSEEYRSMLATQQNARLKRTKNSALTIEELTKDGNDLLTAVTVGSSGLSYKGTEDINFKELYADPEMAWLKDQVYVALEDNANFLAV